MTTQRKKTNVNFQELQKSNLENNDYFAQIAKFGLSKNHVNGGASLYNHQNLEEWIKKEFPNIAKISDKKIRFKKIRNQVRNFIETSCDSVLQAKERNLPQLHQICEILNTFYNKMYLTKNYHQFCGAKTANEKSEKIRKAFEIMIKELNIKVS